MFIGGTYLSMHHLHHPGTLFTQFVFGRQPTLAPPSPDEYTIFTIRNKVHPLSWAPLPHTFTIYKIFAIYGGVYPLFHRHHYNIHTTFTQFTPIRHAYTTYTIFTGGTLPQLHRDKILTPFTLGVHPSPSTFSRTCVQYLHNFYNLHEGFTPSTQYR